MKLPTKKKREEETKPGPRASTKNQRLNSEQSSINLGSYSQTPNSKNPSSLR